MTCWSGTVTALSTPHSLEGVHSLCQKNSSSCWKIPHLSEKRNARALTWRRQWHPTPVLLPGKSHGRRSLVGCSPWGRKESDTTEGLHFHFSLSCTGEGNGNPLQCSCLENPRDGGAWWAATCGVTQSRTQLKRLSSSSSRALTARKKNKGGRGLWCLYVGRQRRREPKLPVRLFSLSWQSGSVSCQIHVGCVLPTER